MKFKPFKMTLSTLCMIVVLATSTVSSMAETNQAKKIDEENAETLYDNLNLFGDVFERVKSSYVEPVENKKLIEAAINGMLTSLDPHSGYLDMKRFEEMQVQTNGEFGGLGIEVTLDSGFVKVVSPIDDTPAAKAGIQAGDYITSLDGEQVLGLTLQEAVDKMRGKVGEPIELIIQREGVAEPIKVKLVRDRIEIHAVRAAEYGNVGYLRITTFNNNTYDNLVSEIQNIKKDIGSKLSGFVIDLRNNPGGLLDQAILVSDAFLDKGEIVSTRSRNVEDTKRYASQSGDLLNGLPLVVIINGGSASASEIVSGALKEHRRAVLVGTKTFGKGSVQSILPLSGGTGALRLTTARYYTPSGNSIQATGIEPDIMIDAGRLDVDKNIQDNISENDLPRHLENERKKQEKKLADKNQSDKSSNGVKIISTEDLAKDIQLKYAIDLIKVMPVVQELQAGNANKPLKEVIEKVQSPVVTDDVKPATTIVPANSNTPEKTPNNATQPELEKEQDKAPKPALPKQKIPEKIGE